MTENERTFFGDRTFCPKLRDRLVKEMGLGLGVFSGPKDRPISSSPQRKGFRLGKPV
jgi:hypothetical protein